MTYLREKTVCFTGHRPEKLPGYGETENASLNVIRSMLYYQIYQSAEEGYKYFISGLARGVDLWAAEYVLEVKNRFPDIVGSDIMFEKNGFCPKKTAPEIWEPF